MRVRIRNLGLAAWLAYAGTAGSADNSNTNEIPMTIQVHSTAFAAGQPIPGRQAFDQQNMSPALQWSGVPAGAKSLALICDDPDAPMGTWVHWVLYAVPAGTTNLAEGVPSAAQLGDGSKQGVNDFKRLGYGGPCPPPGKAHRYFFKLYALDAVPDLKGGATKKELVKAMDGHIIAQGELVGTYQR